MTQTANRRGKTGRGNQHREKSTQAVAHGCPARTVDGRLDMARRTSARLQVFDCFLCPLVFREEVQGMAGEKRVVRFSAAGVHVPLQVKAERAARFPRRVGQGSRKRAAK